MAKKYNFSSLTKQNPSIKEEEGNRSEPLRLPREIINLDIFEDIFILGAFVDLLKLANTRQSRIMWRNRQREQITHFDFFEIRFLRKGEFTQSFGYLCNRWNIGTRKLYELLSLLEENNLIRIVTIEEQKAEEARELTEWEKSNMMKNGNANYSNEYGQNLYIILFDFFFDQTNQERNGENQENLRLESTLRNGHSTIWE